ncbi:hypothetical protein [Serratia entomophila]|uniref:hypothetical protein n=1 Tax=Serratia entomophila TaxID=42906 RepID=UPI00217C654F|nr:hypothetical protein [Serratia entomophila]CAI1674842.1 Uncharacterised protein [Serratia entomophila]CAI1716055.1 Uncharacterised protein [Serratia entomophila]
MWFANKAFFISWRRRALGAIAMLRGKTAAAPVADRRNEWRDYALAVGASYQRFLAGDAAAVQRLRAFLGAQPDRKQRGLPPSITLRIWLDAEGRVERLVIVSALDQGPTEADLRQVLTAQPLEKRPPPGMPMPLLLRLWLRHEGKYGVD